MNITRTSAITGKSHTIDLAITAKEIEAYANGALLQDAFPDLAPSLREFYKTGITPEEWDQFIVGTAIDGNKAEVAKANPNLFGIAEKLGEWINSTVRPDGEPPSMGLIRVMAMTFAREASPNDAEFIERHFYEYGDWFSEFKFTDNSLVVFGDDEV